MQDPSHLKGLRSSNKKREGENWKSPEREEVKRKRRGAEGPRGGETSAKTEYEAR